MASLRASVVLLAVLFVGAAHVSASRVRFYEAVGARRSMLQASDDSSAGGVVVGPRRYLDLNHTQIRGVYQGLGQNYPENVWSSFYPPEAFPNCNNNKTVVNYEHHGVTDNVYVTLSAGTAEDDTHMVEAHHRGSYYTTVASYENGILRLQYSEDGEIEEFCAHWQPYVDELTGEMMVQAVTMALWTKGADGANNYTDLTCDYVAGNEKPGCFLEGVDIARYSSTPAIEARAASLESEGLLANRPEGSVVSTAVATYICRNGECAAFSPKYARIDAEHED